MTPHKREPRELLVKANNDGSPLHSAPGVVLRSIEGFTHKLALSDLAPALPVALADRLSVWSRARPSSGSTEGSVLREHAEAGLEVSRELAQHLGPAWIVRYWDERHSTAKFVCWACLQLHWGRDPHEAPQPPEHIVVAGEFAWAPLRAEGIGDFLPDDPVAGLDLSEGLTADLYRWSGDIDDSMELYLQDRDEDAADARRWDLDHRGAVLADRLACEISPGKTVSYGGLT